MSFQTPTVHPALDARGRGVILKAMRPTTSEYAVLKRLSTNPLRADRRNHTIPVLEIMELGEWAITVTPEWGFGHWFPCVTAAEYVEFARQMFEVTHSGYSTRPC